MTTRLDALTPGTTVRFPFSGTTGTIVRHGPMGTMMRPAGNRHVELQRPDGDAVAFDAPHRAYMVCSSADVEVLA